MDFNWQLLVVDDDPLILDTFSLIIPDNWELTLCEDPQKIPNKLFHAAFIDQHLKDNLSGVSVIKKLSQKFPHTEIIGISGDLTRDLMEDALKAGATRFLAKPLNAEEIRLTLSKIEALQLLKDAQFQRQYEYYLGESLASQELKKAISRLKSEPGPILIEGESGVGKEIIVRLIHLQETHSSPLIAVNIAAIPDNLFESELFGHAKGSFTGALQNKMGLIEAADKGDLFLDEVEALSEHNQVKLLRFLENQEVRRVGDTTSKKVSTRVLAASNQSLEELVEKGVFRKDLFWRLQGKRIIIPPLRERSEDIQGLAQFFVDKLSNKFNKQLSLGALKTLTEYSWPGNIRELKKICEQLCLLSPLPIIRSEDVNLILKAKEPQKKKKDLTRGLHSLMSEYEKSLIEKALKEYREIDKITEVLGISRSNLYKKIKDYSISL